MQTLGPWKKMNFGGMALSLAIIVVLVLLWRWGSDTLRNVTGALAIMKGVVGLVGVVRVYVALLEKLTPEQWETLWKLVGYTMPVYVLLALINIAIGRMILYLPSIQAFFRHQRGEGWAAEFEVDDF